MKGIKVAVNSAKFISMKYGTILITAFLFFTTGCNEAPADKPEPNPLPQKLWTESDRRYILAELDRTTSEILKETERLGNDQWFFQETEFRWSIASIIEHLIVQNELHYREISSISNMPELPEYLPVTTGQDDYYKAYATAPEKRQAKWFLQPIGRFYQKRYSMEAFQRARDGLHDFVEATEVDLRQRYIFKKGASEKNITELRTGEVMDLHQLLLTGIAHTDRHLQQIRDVKKHPNYPKDI